MTSLLYMDYLTGIARKSMQDMVEHKRRFVSKLKSGPYV